MQFKEYEVVKILIDSNEGVKKGDIGVILMVFESPQEAYEVEIVDEDGNHKGLCTLLPNEIELV